MAAIDIGSAAINRGFSTGALFTYVDRANPANDSGTITSFEIWAVTNLVNTKVGTFSGSGTSWNDRDYEAVGTVTAGSKQTFSGLDCDVESGDIFGTYFTGGTIEYDVTGGSGVGCQYGDYFGSGAQTYIVFTAASLMSLYGIGETPAGGWTNIAKVSGIAAASIGKINGIAVASIGKINGVAI